MGRKLGALPPLWGRESWVLIHHNVAWAKTYRRAKWHLDPSSHLATTDMRRKLGAPPLLGEGQLGPHIAQCGLVETYPRAKWHLDSSSRLATIDMGRKLGVPPLPLWGGQLGHLGWGLSPYQVASWFIQPFGGGELGPCLTQCGQGRGLPACQVSSWSNQPFGHSTPTLQTGQTGQTDRQTDRQTGQRSDSIGRTALQTVVGRPKIT